MRRYTVVIDSERFTIDVEETASDRFLVTVGDRTFAAMLEADEDLPGAPISIGMADVGEPRPAVPFATTGAAPVGPSAVNPVPGPAVRERPPTGPAAGSGSAAGTLAAPMPGVILAIEVKAGDAVRRGDALLILEAMKMRNTIRAPRDGLVAAVLVEPGQPVAQGTPMIRLGAAPG